MSDWGYLPNEYEIAIGEISHRKRLIVEGPTDKNVFKEKKSTRIKMLV